MQLPLTTKEAIVLVKTNLVRTCIDIPMFIFSRVPRARKKRRGKARAVCSASWLNAVEGDVCYKCSQDFSASGDAIKATDLPCSTNTSSMKLPTRRIFFFISHQEEAKKH